MGATAPWRLWPPTRTSHRAHVVPHPPLPLEGGTRTAAEQQPQVYLACVEASSSMYARRTAPAPTMGRSSTSGCRYQPPWNHRRSRQTGTARSASDGVSWRVPTMEKACAWLQSSATANAARRHPSAEPSPPPAAPRPLPRARSSAYEDDTPPLATVGFEVPKSAVSSAWR